MFHYHNNLLIKNTSQFPGKVDKIYAGYPNYFLMYQFEKITQDSKALYDNVQYQLTTTLDHGYPQFHPQLILLCILMSPKINVAERYINSRILKT